MIWVGFIPTPMLLGRRSWVRFLAMHDLPCIARLKCRAIVNPPTKEAARRVVHESVRPDMTAATLAIPMLVTAVIRIRAPSADAHAMRHQQSGARTQFEVFQVIAEWNGKLV